MVWKRSVEPFFWERFEGLSYRISLISLRVSLKRVSICWIIDGFWGWMESYRIKKRRGEIETSQNEYQIVISDCNKYTTNIGKNLEKG